MDFPFPIAIPEGAPKEAIAKSPLIKRWYNSINSDIKVSKVDVITADMFGRRLGMVELDVTYVSNEISHTERVILTGRSSMMVILLKDIATSELYTVLVHQPRIGTGTISYEFPAGMADDSQDFKAVAVREIKEEVGLTVTIDDLIPVSELYRPNDPYTFINDEHYDMGCYVFMVKKEMSLDEIMAFNGRNGGIDVDEQIELEVVKFADVWKYVKEPASLGTRYMISELIESGKIVV